MTKIRSSHVDACLSRFDSRRWCHNQLGKALLYLAIIAREPKKVIFNLLDIDFIYSDIYGRQNDQIWIGQCDFIHSMWLHLVLTS